MIWRYLNSEVYVESRNNLDNFGKGILNQTQINIENILNAIKRFHQKLMPCQDVNSAQFEHLIHFFKFLNIIVIPIAGWMVYD